MNLFGKIAIAAGASLWVFGCADQSGQSTDSMSTFELVREIQVALADDALEGRRPGTSGYKEAAAFVSSRFKELGLVSMSGGDDYCQTVPLSRTELDDDASSITIGADRYGADDAELLIQPSLRETKQTLGGDAVFVGYGIEAPELGLSPYEGVDVDGKVVVFLNGFPKGLPGLPAAHRAAAKTVEAFSRGAVATIEIETPRSLARRDWTLIRDFFTEPFSAWTLANGDAADGVEAGRATVRTTGRVTEALFAESTTPLTDVMHGIDDVGHAPPSVALNRSVEIARVGAAERLESCNIVGVLQGSDGARANEAVFMTAHLDHMGRKGEEIYNGAFDNALGVAIMLETARQLATNGKRPARSIIFAAVTAEEEGLLGADYLARNFVEDSGLDPVAVYNVDMPVLTYPFEDVVFYGSEESTLGRIAIQSARGFDIAVSADPSPAEGLYVRSDHYAFVKQGVPAIYTKTGVLGEGAEIKARFMRDHYHQPSDDLSIALDEDAVRRFVALHVEMIGRTANAPDRPNWFSQSIFGASVKSSE